MIKLFKIAKQIYEVNILNYIEYSRRENTLTTKIKCTGL
jgi:hypothetical protein